MRTIRGWRRRGGCRGRGRERVACPLRTASRSSSPRGGRGVSSAPSPRQTAKRSGGGKWVRSHANLAVSGKGKGRGAPDIVRSVCSEYRFDEASRSAPSLSGSPLAGGALNALPEAPPADGSRSIGIPGPRAYPPHACCSRRPRTLRHFCHPRVAPPRWRASSRSPPKRKSQPTSALRSIAPRRRIGRWPCALSLRRGEIDYAAGLSAAALVTLILLQGVERIGVR